MAWILELLDDRVGGELEALSFDTQAAAAALPS
jgi:hypothetical protein